MNPKYQVKKKTSFDTPFFQDFVSLYNRIYKKNDYVLMESLEYYKDFLVVFSRYNEWAAILVYEGEVPVGRVFVSTRWKDEFKQYNFIPFGYFEAINAEVADMLINSVTLFAKERGYPSVRGPINGNAYNQSRFCLWRKEKPFFTEPVHSSRYIEDLKRNGFEEFQRWQSWSFPTLARLKSLAILFTKRSRKVKKLKNYNIRHVNLNQWDEEVKIFYDLLTDSFRDMQDVEGLSLEEFSYYMSPLKQLLRQQHCLVMEKDGKPIGFICALMDWLPTLKSLEGSFPVLGKLKFVWHQKTGQGRVLVLYLGKVQDENTVSGIAFKLMRTLSQKSYGFLGSELIFGYMQSGSKSSAVTPEYYKVISEYATYTKSL